MAAPRAGSCGATRAAWQRWSRSPTANCRRLSSTSPGVTASPTASRISTTSADSSREAATHLCRSPTTLASSAYEYVDVSNTFLASLVKNIVPMLEPDPRQEHETLMDLFGGLLVLAGPRDERAKNGEMDGDTKIKYRGYRADASPLLDFVYAAAQLLATPHSDETLALVDKLAKDKPHVLARLVGVGFKIKAIADAHPEANLPAKSTLWDDMLDVLVAIAQKEKPGEPGKQKLVEDLIRAFGNDACSI